MSEFNMLEQQQLFSYLHLDFRAFSIKFDSLTIDFFRIVFLSVSFATPQNGMWTAFFGMHKLMSAETESPFIHTYKL